jgi:hypothetical protein
MQNFRILNLVVCKVTASFKWLTTNEELCGHLTEEGVSLRLIEVGSLRHETEVLTTQLQLRRKTKVSQSGQLVG